MSMQKQMTWVAAVMFALGCGGLRAQQSSPPANEPTGALLNGALTAPGAPTDTDTVPAKFSQKNAADDKLIIVAYTFKNLSDDQRREISEALKAQPDTAGVNAEIGTELPFSVELRPVPDALAARVPQTKGYEYVKAGNRVMLISPPTRIVVGVFGSG
jgi:Protein of unknown function (DUF1236)